MDTDAVFDAVRRDISEGRTSDVGPKLLALAEGDGTPFNLIKCLSLLKVVRDSGATSTILGMLMDSLPDDVQGRVEVAGALRGLDYPALAYSILKDMDQTDPIRRISVMCQMDLDEYETALDILGRMGEMAIVDRIMLVETLSALGEHARSVDAATELLAESPGLFDARRAYVSSLVLAGRDKDAVKYVRACLKDKSSESNALAGYVMRVVGNTKAAAGYATRALQTDPRNISAMETLGICLAEKGEIDKARIVAGAINEISPGDRAALNVISYCD